jgi:hypothetical protein
LIIQKAALRVIITAEPFLQSLDVARGGEQQGGIAMAQGMEPPSIAGPARRTAGFEHPVSDLATSSG